MPIEIRELVIRAVVAETWHEHSAPEKPEKPDDNQDAIIEECVRQVLKILKQNNER